VWWVLPAGGGIDDIAFLTALLDRLEARYHIDERRVYATGISNGGLLAYRLACERSSRFSAIAPVAATMVVSCDPELPVSVLHLHGSADENVPIRGGRGTKGVSRVVWPSVASALASWRSTDRCRGPVRTLARGAVTRTRWRCAAGTDVELVVIAGGGHSWPGGERLSRILDPPSDALDATAEIWSFFAAHPRR
jgi:polyhydroxybutyrate depolymerase